MMDIYQERAVAFIHLMEFDSVIDESANDSAQASAILTALKYVEETTVKKKHDVWGLKLPGKQMTIFSNSIAISYPVEYNSGALYQLLVDVCHLQLNLLDKGFFVRGGVSVGKLYHEGNMVFGPALAEARQLEAKVAKYARVVLSEEFYQEALEYRYEAHTIMEEERFLAQLLLKDKKDDYYLDFFRISEFNTLDEAMDLHKKTKRLLKDRLKNKALPKKAREKLVWFKKYLKYAKEKYSFE
ncbi:hypothetical protein [Aneurinibacillus aneurinilyticus]|jgi:hypothetical protein|uniref:Uncharacterized protein n=1 Tax=Aneurinibacillus aneurinilyticus TaxID=1391 RepID=A0A848CUD6_ANEAE|nr:hypothetical protein [Aneurinibacillus aneurinilyticus]NME99215.1 hypothetical protein [Aneurinibacillus aneurinilyticus]